MGQQLRACGKTDEWNVCGHFLPHLASSCGLTSNLQSDVRIFLFVRMTATLQGGKESLIFITGSNMEHPAIGQADMMILFFFIQGNQYCRSLSNRIGSHLCLTTCHVLPYPMINNVIYNDRIASLVNKEWLITEKKSWRTIGLNNISKSLILQCERHINS